MSKDNLIVPILEDQQTLPAESEAWTVYHAVKHIIITGDSAA